MKQPLLISIPNPCSQKWEEMTPCNDGRFCGHCKNIVVDFTMWNDTQVFNYYQQHQGEHFCGRYLTSQLNRPIIPAQPKSRLYRMFIGLGLVLIFTQVPAAHAQVKANTNAQRTPKKNQDTPTKTYQLKGTVSDEKDIPVTSAVIQLTRGISPLDMGTYTITVSMQGYKPIKTELIINGDQELNFKMHFDQQYLKSIEQPINMGIPPHPYYKSEK